MSTSTSANCVVRFGPDIKTTHLRVLKKAHVYQIIAYIINISKKYLENKKKAGLTKSISL